jgi:hypothetical protein
MQGQSKGFAAVHQIAKEKRSQAATKAASGTGMFAKVFASILGDPAVPATPKAPTTARSGSAKKMQYGGASSSKLNEALKRL